MGIGTKHRGVAHHVEHDLECSVLPAPLLGGHWMEDVTRLYLEPAHLLRLPPEGHHPHPRAVRVVPHVGERGAGCGHVEVEGDRQVVEHQMPLGDRAVVDHRVAGHRHVDPVDHPAGGRLDHRVLQHVGPGPVVADRMQEPGRRVDLGMGGVAVGQAAAEVGMTQRVEGVAQLDGTGAGLDDGHGAAADADHVGIRRLHAAVALAGGRWLTERLAHVGRAHPTVAVPLGPTVPQAQAVHHRVAGEPVVGGRVDRPERVGAVAQVAPVQLRRQGAGDDQVGERHLLGDRRIGALEVPVR